MNSLGNRLTEQFKQTWLIDDLNRTINITDMTVNTIPQDHPDRTIILNDLGNKLGTRFEQTGLLDDLNRAIDISNIVVNTTPQDHPNRAGWLNNIGRWLSRRFEWTGSIDDLNCAVNIINMAINATPQNHPNQACRLNNLGILLGWRFELTRSIDDLNHAINVTNIAVNTTPQDHPDRAGWLNNLGHWLGRQFEQTKSMDNLNYAIDISNMAVNATPQNHLDRAVRLSNLGKRLGKRFDQTGSIDDLNCAIDVAEMAVNAAPQNHPNRADWLESLGNLLCSRFNQTRSMDDLNRALSYFKEGWACHNSRPFVRIRLAHCAARVLASQLNWEESSDFLQGAVKLLPIVSPRLLGNNDKQRILGQFAGLASETAAISLEAGKDEHYALKLLELGRCVIASLLLEMRTDISDLKEQHPGLAADFESLRNELDSPSDGIALLGDTQPSWEVQENRRFKADQKFNEVIAKIRDHPGFQNFLLPPTHDELMAAADQGPIIIINISSYRCDAFLIEHRQIRVLPLPNLREEELNERVQQLSVGSTPVLEWLWNVAVGPILDELGYQRPSSNNWPRVWWIPTGALSHFPIHAAGFHTKGSTETVLDRVMSSYSSSIKAIVYGRQHSVRRPAESTSEQALLVAMKDTPGLNSDLPFATTELEMLADLCPSLQLKPVMPPQRRGEVLAHLRTGKIFHFAGHGRSDPQDPSQSCLLLEDCPLTVGDLRDCKIQESSPFLGYLSACSTSANKVDTLVDEGIHLASALQLAGFRHVIGTLWEVSDKYCVDVARVVYETIRHEGMTDMAICRGLHQAVKALRDGRIDGKNRDAVLCDESGETKVTLPNPLYWAPYIHFGV